MVTQTRWQDTDIASQALVDPVLDDIGIDNPQVREAARKWAIEYLEEQPGTMEMGDWQQDVGCFANGYEQALKDSRG